MKNALFVALLCLAAPALAAQPPKRAKPAKPVKAKPPPPPEPEEPEEPEEPAPADLPDEPDAPDAPQAPHAPKRNLDDFNQQYREWGGTTGEDLQAAVGAAMCGCFCFVVGLVGLVIWLVRRSNRPAATAGAAPAQAPPPPAAAAAPPPPSIPFHLSVLAIGMHATARQLVSQQLILSGAQADPADAPERAKLVRELAKAVRGLESEWTHFGYGERLDLADDAAAQRSYQLAVEDFGRRSGEASISGESTYAVMTLVLCTRRQLRGVSALDDRAQIRTLLEERAGLADAELMGAYIAWSAPLGGPEVLTRFPEMHAVR